MKQIGWMMAAALCAPGFGWAFDCAALDKTANATGVQIAGSASGQQVVGKGRLQFYSAPDEHCAMKGVFIIPGDKVDGYTESGGFTSVLYLNPKTHGEAQGWVKSTRLQPTGVGVAPSQPNP